MYGILVLDNLQIKCYESFFPLIITICLLFNNRVKSAHSVTKDMLGTSNLSLDSIFMRLHSMIEVPLGEIIDEMENMRTRVFLVRTYQQGLRRLGVDSKISNSTAQ